MDLYDDYPLEEDKMGMTVTSGSVTLLKDSQNLIGISIGGGAPYCPCLYVVQIFDNTSASKDGSLLSGDEITGVNQQSVKGKSKVEVARLIQSYRGEVTINYNKLHADPKQGKTLDIILKKVKHRLVEKLESSTADALGLSRAILVNVLKKVKHRVVENMTSSTADAFGLSRAILCNVLSFENCSSVLSKIGFLLLINDTRLDGLVKRLDEMNKTGGLFFGLVEHSKFLVRAIYDLSKVYRAFGEVFSQIGVKEPQPRASEAFTIFGNAHRNMERYAMDMLKKIKPMISDLNTFLTKAIPDTRLTIKKYLDAKFEYLSYCLKVKEMDDEEYSASAMQEPLYRVETGNYEYRLVLRCRQDARIRFAKMRNDVLVKIELLDNKHVQDIVCQLDKFVKAMSKYHQDCLATMKETDIFPIEVDLSRHTFTYDKSNQFDDVDDEDDEILDTTEYEPKTNRNDTSKNAVEKDSDLLKDFGDSFADLDLNSTENRNPSTKQSETVDLLGDLISTN